MPGLSDLTCATISSEDLQRLTTPKARISYPYVFAPRKDDNDKDVWDCVLIMPKPFDKAPLNAIVKTCGLASYGADFIDKVKAGKLEMPKIHDGDKEKPDDPALENAMFIRCTARRKPGVFDQAGTLIPDTEAHRIYAGCYVRAAIRAYAYAYKNANGVVMKKGISFGLQNIQLVGDGEPIRGNVASAENDFAPIAGAARASTGKPADDDDLLGGATVGELIDDLSL